MKKILYLFLFLVAALVFFAGYSKGQQQSEPQSRPEDGEPVYISASLFHNRDSILYYTEKAYLEDDPKGLFVVGVAARLRLDGSLPEDIPTVPLDEADIMLLHSADLGYPDAIQAIHCLAKHGCWNHSMPEDKVTLRYKEIIEEYGEHISR